MESYIFERDLLSEDDLKKYYALSDKHNMELINAVIASCRKRILLLLDSDELFPVTVYFKFKKFDTEQKQVIYRPIHTASLEDQICMIAMLQPIMFNDGEKRSFSDLTKLLPSNFYGNIPSTRIDELFVNWKKKYKQYTEKVLESFRRYKDTKEYRTLIRLDIQDFYPSVDPGYILEYIVDKLSIQFPDKEEIALKRVLTKLLFFTIKSENIEGWEELYYNGNVLKSSAHYYTRGIPQGLPQSYYFGNLFMVEAAKKVSELFPGESYYYVDDSVIFSDEEFSSESFNLRIEDLNNSLSFNKSNKKDIYNSFLSQNLQEIIKNIHYVLKYHQDEKSEFQDIEKSKEHGFGLALVAAQVSKGAMFYNNISETDDNISASKFEELIKAIDHEIKRIKEVDGQGKDLKSLKQYRRYFLYRLRLLNYRNEDVSGNSPLEKSFIEKLKDKNAFYATYDEDIYQAEVALICRNKEFDKLNDFKSEIEHHEREMCGNGRAETFLYTVQCMKSVILEKSLSTHKYDSLCLFFKRSFGNKGKGKFKERMRFFKENFTVTELSNLFNDINWKFVAKNSEEFNRRIYNALYSTLCDVDVSDELAFYKRSNRPLTYFELRILAYLRNRNFHGDDFRHFFEKLYKEIEDPVNSTGSLNITEIDPLIFQVLSIFIHDVRDADKVDDLIQTHRLVNGLWKNGSKFLNSYTLHNEEHAVQLIRSSKSLLNVFDDLSLKRYDYYLFYLSCYLHDISMVIHPDMGMFNKSNITTNSKATDYLSETIGIHENLKLSDVKALMLHVFNSIYEYFENEVRSKHPSTSADFIIHKGRTFLNYLNASVRQHVAEISKSHGEDISYIYGLKSDAKDKEISLKYMMILIRLADLMDMSKNRVNYYLLKSNLNHLSQTSKFHWISHFITDGIDLVPEFNTKDEDLFKRPIQENIVFNIHLNYMNLAMAKNDNQCKGRSAEVDSKNRTINISIGSGTCKGKCSVSCLWMKYKNEYLFNELYALQKYIQSLNSSIFYPRITVKIDCPNPRVLEPDLRTEVLKYLKQ